MFSGKIFSDPFMNDNIDSSNYIIYNASEDFYVALYFLIISIIFLIIMIIFLKRERNR